MPTAKDLKDASWPTVRGTAVGAFFGVLPGTGPALSSFATYMLEKKIAKDPSRFGQGRDRRRGGAGSSEQRCRADFVHPDAHAGHPRHRVMALMLGAMTMQGIAPGPQVMTAQPELFWGIIASMWIGNLAARHPQPAAGGDLGEAAQSAVPLAVSFDHHVLLHRQLQREQQSGRRVSVRARRRARLHPRQARCEPAPLLLGYVLGPLMEEYLRRAMLLSRGDPSVFFTRPISLAFVTATLLILAVMIAPAIRKKQ